MALLHSEYLTRRTGRFAGERQTRQALTDDLFEERRLLGAANDLADQAVADYLGLNRTDARCLDIIERLRGVTAGRLARESGLSTGAVTTVLDRLERSGLARRTSDPEDRRRVARRDDPGRARGQRGALPRRSSRPPTRADAPLLRGGARAAAGVPPGQPALTEAHAERVRGLLRAPVQEGEAASS